MVGDELGREVMGVRAYGKERGRDAGKMDLVNTHIRTILRQHDEFSGAVVSASLPTYLTLAKDTYLHTKPHMKPHDNYTCTCTYTSTSTYNPSLSVIKPRLSYPACLAERSRSHSYSHHHIRYEKINKHIYMQETLFLMRRHRTNKP